MKDKAGVMEVQLEGLKFDNVDCLEPLALQIEVSNSAHSTRHPSLSPCDRERFVGRMLCLLFLNDMTTL
jgi:hypothetical protein